MNLYVLFGQFPRHWADAPIHNRRARRCGNSPENVSLHHSSPCENHGGRSWASRTASATCAPAASRRSPCMLLASRAAVPRCGAEAVGIEASEPGSSLARDARVQSLLLGRDGYGAWTQNLSQAPPHACPTPDVPGVAAGDHHPGRPSPPGPDTLTRRGWPADHGHCRRGREEPSLCLQMGAAVSRAGHRGVSEPTAPGFSARVAPGCPGGRTPEKRMTPRGHALIRIMALHKESPLLISRLFQVE